MGGNYFGAWILEFGEDFLQHGCCLRGRSLSTGADRGQCSVGGSGNFTVLGLAAERSRVAAAWESESPSRDLFDQQHTCRHSGTLPDSDNALIFIWHYTEQVQHTSREPNMEK